MAENAFQVVFDGQLVEGADPGQVRANLARLFKTEVARVEPLFAGHRTVVRKGLDADTARKYRIAFERAGAIATVTGPAGEVFPAPESGAPANAGSAAPAATQNTPAPAAPFPGSAATPSPPAAETNTPAHPEPEAGTDTPNRLALAEAGRAPPPLLARGVPAAPADMTMADAGATLVEDRGGPAAPDIDTSHLSLSEPGADLVEAKRVDTPEFDLSGLDLAPPGAPLGGEVAPPDR